MKNQCFFQLLLMNLIFATSSSIVSGMVVPHPLFNAHCVLQRGGPVPVWGTADPGEVVEVVFRDQHRETTADASGYWSLELDPGDAGGPFELIISGQNEVRFKDVMVGEVWLCSGQSNMEWGLCHPDPGNVLNSQAEAATADYPGMRHFKVERATAQDPQSDLTGQWQVCSPETVRHWTAVGYYFGRDLLKSQDVPIGLIHSSWGGTPAQAWTSEEAVSAFSNYKREIALSRQWSDSKDDYPDQLHAWANQQDPISPDENGDSPESDNRDWSQIRVPGYWDDQGYADFNGFAWYRKSFELPESWVGKDLVLELGTVDDHDSTWLNGELLGANSDYYTNRSYPIAAKTLDAGPNELVIRVLDTGGAGGIVPREGDPDTPFLRLADDAGGETVSLQGEWDFRLSKPLADLPPAPQGRPDPQVRPAMLFNGMISPIIPYAMRGVIWYQGESNAGKPVEYRDLFPAMIRDWRTRWHRGEFPFLFVQIAPHVSQPPEIREAQLLALQKVPNSAMAVTIDVGDADNIHPANKEPVGQRLALAARALAYGEAIPYSGPTYDFVEFIDGRAVVHFLHTVPGLVAGGGGFPLRGFTIAGRDGDFQPANAVIEGDTVAVWSESIPKPVAVRYAWANVADGNLYNRAGLPASPFRTDVDPVDPEEVSYTVIPSTQRDALWDIRDSHGPIPNLEELYEDRTHPNGLPYHIYIPMDLRAGVSYPLVTFLHGYSDLAIDVHGGHPKGIWSLPHVQSKYPHILFVPRFRTYDDAWWHDDYREMVMEALDDFIAELNTDPGTPDIDTDRLYLAGFSMGGRGTWHYIRSWPEKFAAAVPMAGSTLGPQNLEQARTIRHIPIWIFNGDGDSSAPGSRQSYRMLKETGALDLRYHEYRDQGHVVDDIAFYTDGFMDWLFAQSRQAEQSDP